jgi:LytS/YehU family sensor histidine kinase
MLHLCFCHRQLITTNTSQNKLTTGVKHWLSDDLTDLKVKTARELESESAINLLRKQPDGHCSRDVEISGNDNSSMDLRDV